MGMSILLVCLFLWAAQASFSQAQQVPDSLQKAWADRATRVDRVRISWHFSLHRRARLTPQQKAGIEQQNLQMALEMARKELARQGVPQDAIEKQAREFAAAFVASGSPRDYTFGGELALSRYADKMFVRVQEPAASARGVESILWEVLYDNGVVIAAPQSWSFAQRSYTVANLSEPQREGVGVPWVRVWRSHSPAYLRRLSRFPLFVTPELLILLSGVSPEQMYGGRWTLERESADEWVLRQRVTEGDLAPFTVRIGFLQSRGGAPSWAEVAQERGIYREVYRVTSWRQSFRGVWMAENVSEIRTSDIFEDRRTWQLKQIEPLSQEKNPVPNIPKGMPVADYRLLGASSTLESMSNQRDVMVGYEWEGSLPSERELRRMLARKAGGWSTGPQQLTILWRFLPPLLLITIGILWYWRLKRADGKR